VPVFPKPKFQYAYNLQQQIGFLRAHKAARQVPAKQAGHVLAATWNIANLGAQERRSDDLELIAEVISWFDFVAVQECRENFGPLFDILHQLGDPFRVLCSDASGNNERMAFVFDSTKLRPLEEVGEIAFPVAQYKHVKLPGITRKFDGFDRTPYLVSFKTPNTSIVFVNVHLFYGSEKKADMDRRALETFAVARWANLRKKSPFSFTRELVAMGDFNMPKAAPEDPIFKALTKLGLELPDHTSQIASAIASDSYYDQIAFLPGTTQNCFTGRKGVFDYDQVVFPDLWQNGANKKNFYAYCRYYLSDHRPMWVELAV
jgi:endonuclease/exonuclease/phosphatase family metal-dependent hydrolase